MDIDLEENNAGAVYAIPGLDFSSHIFCNLLIEPP